MALIYERDLWPRQYFDPSCPSGGSWYACTTGSRFVGCCTGSIDPCNATTSCPQKNLKPASFNTSDYGTFSDQSCKTGSNWYTCTGTKPAFMGCCKSNPCSSGCPAKNLTAASLSSDEAAASAFTITTSAAATSTSASSSAASSSTTSDSAATSAAATSVAATTTAASATSAAATASPTDNAGAIAGSVIGGLAGIALILIGILWWLKRARQAQRRKIEHQMEMERPADNEDGWFHNVQGVSEAHSDAGKTETAHSQEDPEGMEVDDRPQEPTSPDPVYLGVKSENSTIRRIPSGTPSQWGPYRDSMARLHFPDPTPDSRPVSFFETPAQFPAPSPAITPLQSQSPHQHHFQTDYFGNMDARQRPVSYELSSAQAAAIGLSPRSPSSPQTQYFELDDTERPPPVELPATEVGTKDRDDGSAPHTPEQKDREGDDADATPFSPDHVGLPRSR